MGHYIGNRWRPLPAVPVQTRANIIILPRVFIPGPVVRACVCVCARESSHLLDAADIRFTH